MHTNICIIRIIDENFLDLKISIDDDNGYYSSYLEIANHFGKLYLIKEYLSFWLTPINKYNKIRPRILKLD